MITIHFRVDNMMHVKIGDFGMAKETYIEDYYTTANADSYIPLRWMAPECITLGRYSIKSDVVNI